jgi:lysophospholipase L1-like esterase
LKIFHEPIHQIHTGLTAIRWQRKGKKMDSVKKGMLMAAFSALLIALMGYGFEFLFSPYNYLPMNGMVEGKLYTWGHLVKNNRYGFRERDFKNPKPSGIYRVMVLGDSLTWGAGLGVEQRYTAIAEELLSKAFPEKKFELLNFGIPGGPTTKERDILEKFKGEVNPDLIVVGFCLNDPQPKRQDWSTETEKLSNSIMGRAIDKTSRLLLDLRLPYVGKLLNDSFYRSAERLGIIPNWMIALGRAYDPSSKEWQEFIQALKDIKATSDELNLPPPIFAVLNTGRLRANNPTSEKTIKPRLERLHQAEKAAADIGFLSYNHEFEIAAQLGNESPVINELDGHPSASMNRVYGDKLYQQIAKQLAASMSSTPRS